MLSTKSWVTSKVDLPFLWTKISTIHSYIFPFSPLVVTETAIIYLSIDHFSFDPFVYTLTRKPKTKPTWKIDDISKGQEPMPISVSELNYNTCATQGWLGSC